jgi:CheY-like chemotaxis protein
MPVILVTAYPNDKDRTRALNNGAFDFLSKPFDDRWLIEAGWYAPWFGGADGKVIAGLKDLSALFDTVSNHGPSCFAQQVSSFQKLQKVA